MELRQLKYFIGVAEELHFGNAAKNLFVSQSALSQQIQNLENEIGVDLFSRAKRMHQHKVELTEAGASLLQDARKIILLCQNAVDKARRLGAKNNVVKLGIFKMLMRDRLSHILTLFSSAFPQVELRIEEYATTQQVHNALLDDSIDLGLTLPDTRLPEITFKVFSEIQRKVVMHHNHPLAGVAAVTPTMLKHEKWIEIQRSINPVHEKTDRIFNKSGIIREIVQEVSNYELVCTLAGIGKGIGLVASSYDFSQDPQIVAKTIVNNQGQPMPEFIIQYALGYRKDRENPLFESLAALI